MVERITAAHVGASIQKQVWENPSHPTPAEMDVEELQDLNLGSRGASFEAIISLIQAVRHLTEETRYLRERVIENEEHRVASMVDHSFAHGEYGV